MNNQNYNCEKTEQIDSAIRLIMQYNQQMYRYGKEFRCYGTDQPLRVDQIAIINLIGDHPQCNLKFIAEATDSNVSTASLQIARLVKLGFIQKQRSAENLREVVLCLTKEGQKAYIFHKTLDDNWMESMKQQLAVYSPEQLQVIEGFLQLMMQISRKG